VAPAPAAPGHEASGSRAVPTATPAPPLLVNATGAVLVLVSDIGLHEIERHVIDAAVAAQLELDEPAPGAAAAGATATPATLGLRTRLIRQLREALRVHAAPRANGTKADAAASGGRPARILGLASISDYVHRTVPFMPFSQDAVTGILRDRMLPDLEAASSDAWDFADLRDAGLPSLLADRAYTQYESDAARFYAALDAARTRRDAAASAPPGTGTASPPSQSVARGAAGSTSMPSPAASSLPRCGRPIAPNAIARSGARQLTLFSGDSAVSHLWMLLHTVVGQAVDGDGRPTGVPAPPFTHPQPTAMLQHLQWRVPDKRWWDDRRGGGFVTRHGPYRWLRVGTWCLWHAVPEARSP